MPGLYAALQADNIILCTQRSGVEPKCMGDPLEHVLAKPQFNYVPSPTAPELRCPMAAQVTDIILYKAATANRQPDSLSKGTTSRNRMKYMH